MTPDEIAAIKAAPAEATFRDVLALVDEIERLRTALERIGSSLTPLEDRDALARRARRALAHQ